MNKSKLNKTASVLLAITVVQGTCGISAFAAEAQSAPPPAPNIVVNDGGSLGFKDGSLHADYARSEIFSDSKNLCLQNVDFTHSRLNAFSSDLGLKSADIATQHVFETSADLNKNTGAPVAAHHDDSLSFGNTVTSSPAAIIVSAQNGTLLSDLRPDTISAGVSQSFSVGTVTGPKSGFSYTGAKDDKVSAAVNGGLVSATAGAERTKNDSLAAKPVVPVSDTLAAILPTVMTSTVHNGFAGIKVDNETGLVGIQTAIGTADKDKNTIPDENKLSIKNAFGEVTCDTKAAGTTQLLTGTPGKIKEGLANRSISDILLGLIPEGTATIAEGSSITKTLDRTGVTISSDKGASSDATLKNDLGIVVHKGAIQQDKSASVNTPAVIANSGLVNFIPAVSTTVGQTGTVTTTVDNEKNITNIKTDNILYDAATVKTQNVSAAHAATVEVKNEVTTASPVGILSTLKGTDGISSLIAAVKSADTSVEVKGGHSFSLTKNADGTATIQSANSGAASVKTSSAIGAASHAVSGASTSTATVPTLAKWLGHLCKTV